MRRIKSLFILLADKFRRRFSDRIDYSRKAGVTIGNGCKLNDIPSWGSEPWLISLGNHVEISSAVTFITHDGATWVFRNQEKYKDVIKYGKISIHDNCFIGMHSTIMPGVEIGPNAIVGAGSLVTKTVPEGCVYAGIPAKYICSVQEYAEKCLNNNLDYDKELYRKDKKKAVLLALEENK